MAIFKRRNRSRMVLRTLLLSAFLGLVACNSSETVDLNAAPKPAESGQKLYKKYCQSCHGKTGDARRGNAADLTTSTMTDAQVRNVILNGNDKGMMGYKNLFETEAELDSLVQHVFTLRTK